jgi:hypothetical protein
VSACLLIEAIKAGNETEALQLIEAGRGLDERDDNEWTPLCWAAAKGSSALVTSLLHRGADPFITGVDLRTPYKIALAAGRREVVIQLAQAEEERGGDEARISSREGELRPYSRAYLVSDLRPFPGWVEPGEAERMADDDVVFLHRDLTVTKMIWLGEDVVYDKVTPEWIRFCHDVLSFEVPTDLDLIQED